MPYLGFQNSAGSRQYLEKQIKNTISWHVPYPNKCVNIKLHYSAGPRNPRERGCAAPRILFGLAEKNREVKKKKLFF